MSTLEWPRGIDTAVICWQPSAAPILGNETIVVEALQNKAMQLYSQMTWTAYHCNKRCSDRVTAQCGGPF